MQRILYYIFIYNILFEGVFEGEKPPSTSLRRGERKKLSGISNPPILADTKREMPNEEDWFGETAPKSRQTRRWGVRFLAPMSSIISRKYARKMKNVMLKKGKKGVLMCEEAFVRKIFIQLRPMETKRRA